MALLFKPSNMPYFSFDEVQSILLRGSNVKNARKCDCDVHQLPYVQTFKLQRNYYPLLDI